MGKMICLKTIGDLLCERYVGRLSSNLSHADGRRGAWEFAFRNGTISRWTMTVGSTTRHSIRWAHASVRVDPRRRRTR